MLFDNLGAGPIYTGLREVRRLAGLRGRLEVLQDQPLVVADVAHNLPSLKAALAFVRAHRPQDRLDVLLGVKREKDEAGMARALAEAQATVYPVQPDSKRAVPTDVLAAHLRAQGVPVVEGGSLAEGRAWFRRVATAGAVFLITGSHQVVTHAPALVRPSVSE